MVDEKDEKPEEPAAETEKSEPEKAETKEPEKAEEHEKAEGQEKAEEPEAAAKAEEPDAPAKAEEPAAKSESVEREEATPKKSDPSHPLSRFDNAWTRLEARLATYVLFAEIGALCLWVSLKGMSADYKPGLLDADGNPVPVDTSGLVYRCVALAVIFGLIANRVARGRTKSERTIAVSVGIVAGLGLGRLFASAGSEYFSNLLNWMQTASMLTLFGGLRGLATRLTLWLALLGGSLATGQGKHINVDVAMRFLTPKLRVPVAVLGWVTAAAVCLSGAYGFFDHIAIEGYKVRAVVPCANDATKDCDKPFGDKFAEVKKGVGTDLFLFGRQASLDLKTIGVVLGGHDYNNYLKAKEWNGDLVFLHEAGPGPADRSYGVQVARLAGVPPTVVARAREVLDRLESQKTSDAGLADLPLFAAVAAPETTFRGPSQADQALAQMDVDGMSPREALDALYRLKALSRP